MISRASLMRCLMALAGGLLLANCSSTEVSLDYQPGLSQAAPGPRKLSAGRFSDMRREGSYYLGTVRTPIGSPMERVNTRIPVEQVVRNAFAHGMTARGMLSGRGAPYVLTGEILDLHCDQVIRPAAYAKIRVNVVRASSGQVVFSRIYSGERENSAYLPGSGSPVPMLRELASRALQDVVDRALDDNALRARLSPSPPYGPDIL
ncbi:MAG: hypothetical protein ACAH88_08175 [Roseimicrobium sp.]